MNYCGACGGFYTPECPHATPGATSTRCCPAPNPHDEAHADKLMRIAGCNAEVAGMIAENANHNHPRFGQQEFYAVMAKWEIWVPK